ncbi:hypothetical protein HELRODRAFT_160367 [Helobdella robusta]|uniref:Uncharacterized protein n=1 Tax=Helobdella robusta TaxID=6412 RepID=T1EQ54_HELRO|nr:hypothetical protein HELRODRAFT_160367 [Helobdella robusta]ESO06209.1 hypothetical protein HELRODRAFT_160367 [Helobdella robusta]
MEDSPTGSKNEKEEKTNTKTVDDDAKTLHLPFPPKSSSPPSSHKTSSMEIPSAQEDEDGSGILLEVDSTKLKVYESLKNVSKAAATTSGTNVSTTYQRVNRLHGNTRSPSFHRKSRDRGQHTDDRSRVRLRSRDGWFSDDRQMIRPFYVLGAAGLYILMTWLHRFFISNSGHYYFYQ